MSRKIAPLLLFVAGLLGAGCAAGDLPNDSLNPQPIPPAEGERPSAPGQGAPGSNLDGNGSGSGSGGRSDAGDDTTNVEEEKGLSPLGAATPPDLAEGFEDKAVAPYPLAVEWLAVEPSSSKPYEAHDDHQALKQP